MKSFTDLPQSKILAEFLPKSSADMAYLKYASSDNLTFRFEGALPMVLGDIPIDEIDCETLPCWSFPALLGLIPDKISINNESYYLSFTKTSVEFKGPITWDGQKTKSFEMDNIIDAAFEMVCWLKENGKI